MNAADLRTAQAPLKAAYREDPSAAHVTLKASGTPDVPEQVCRVHTFLGVVDAGLHPATGGDGTKACSGDMLLEALVACAGVTLGAVATSMGIALKSARVGAEGVIDFRGTLGVSREAPVGFREIRLRFELETDAEPEAQRKLIDLTERYCAIYQTLKHPAVLESTTG